MLQEAIESGQAPPKSSGFSFKGLSSMIFGAESPEVLGTKISNLEEQISDAEEVVKTTKEDLRCDTIILLIHSWWMSRANLKKLSKHIFYLFHKYSDTQADVTYWY